MGLRRSTPPPVYEVRPAVSPRQSHHMAILADFEAAGARVAECQTLHQNALDVVAEVERELERAQGRAEAAKRLLRRVSEGHI